ncbi:GM13340 [Drosophila sechellia]|uniref:GM13340 n=2 Tax=Drosophila sechellia TaxID=7238 RepID=B4IEX2_DROSE|nr:GM13340 [Drosophila sechellia]
MEKQEVLGNVANVVRALIPSAKPPVELRSIVEDYMEIEGETIPFRRLGHSNDQELLKDTNQFNSGGRFTYCNKYHNQAQNMDPNQQKQVRRYCQTQPEYWQPDYCQQQQHNRQRDQEIRKAAKREKQAKADLTDIIIQELLEESSIEQ